MRTVQHDLRVCEAAPRLLKSCKELRDALEGAMRVMVSHACAEGEALTDDFVAEMAKLGIAPGIGVRADNVIADAEGRPRPHVIEPEPIESQFGEPDPRD